MRDQCPLNRLVKQVINTSVIILAGGESRRMYYPKPFLLYNSESTFLQKIVAEYMEVGCRQVVIVLNHELLNERWNAYFEDLPASVVIIPNDHPESGRFYSIRMGLSGLERCDYCFVQDIDNPFVDVDLLELMFHHRNGMGYTVPYWQGKGGHPVLISRSMINYMLKLKTGHLNWREVLVKFKKRPVSVLNDKVLVNINAPEDYRKYFELVK